MDEVVDLAVTAAYFFEDFVHLMVEKALSLSSALSLGLS